MKPFLNVLSGKPENKLPFWFMRQAGRYLPEYRELRARAGTFLDMAYNPDFASEITMQPIRRFGMDAAIIFSDILVVPHALGMHLEFAEGEGPKLNPLINLGIDNLKPEIAGKTYQNVYAALSQTKEMLAAEEFDSTALIGFCGAPWTVACYMIEGSGSKDFEKARLYAYSDPIRFQKLIDLLILTSSEYLIGQVRAGAEVLQIFDSWSGLLEANQFHRWVIAPTKAIVSNVRKEFPNVPIIGFPKGAGVLSRDYALGTGINAISLDHQIPTSWAARSLQTLCPVQGNLDPLALLAGGDALKLAFEKLCHDLKSGPFVFNLGHGIVKDTPVAHVEALVAMIKGL